MVFKVKYEKAGGHLHYRLYAAKSPNTTYAACGDFCTRQEEFNDLRLAMSGVFFEEVRKHGEESG